MCGNYSAADILRIAKPTERLSHDFRRTRCFGVLQGHLVCFDACFCLAAEKMHPASELMNAGQLQREFMLICDDFYKLQLLEEFIISIDDSQTFGNTDRRAAAVDVRSRARLRFSVNLYRFFG